MAADFLVIADQQMQRPLQAAGLEIRHGGQAGRDESLHVAGAAADQRPVRTPQREWVRGPGLAVHRHRIDMAAESQSAGFPRADDGMQGSLLSRGVGADAVENPEPVEIIADEINQRKIWVPARAVEGYQA